MDYLAITDIDTDMSPIIEYITGLYGRITDLSSRKRLGIGGSGKRYSKVFKYCRCKA